MQLQEGFDIGTWLFPMLTVVGLCFLGLVTWLISIMVRNKNKPDAQSVPLQLSEVQDAAPPYILAIRRSGPGWEIYVKGQRANAFSAAYDVPTRTEIIEALRELARFGRDILQGSTTPMQTVQKSSEETSPTGPEMPLTTSQTVRVGTVSGTAPVRTRANTPVDAPLPPSSVPVMDLAREIGEIVDEFLARSPSLQNHAVTLMNAQTKGINFVVDGVIYNAVEEIPNPEIQALIRQATREWERR